MKEFVPVKGGCVGCSLQGKTVVFPSGKLKKSRLVIVGQAPGREEIEEGKPFVGRAGRKLWTELTALGIKRNECYVTNVVKCRPERTTDGSGDKPPDAATIKRCAKQFEKEWEKVKGKNILLLGNVACKRMTKKAMSTLRGRVVDDLGDDNSYVAVWHPSFIIRNTDENFSLIWRRELSVLTSLLSKPAKRPAVDFTVVEEVGSLRTWMKYFSNSPEPVSIDIETTSKQPSAPESEILTIAFSDGIRTCVMDMRKLGSSTNVIHPIKKFLESDHRKIAQNAKFESVWFRYKYGAFLNNIYFDPSMAQYLLDKGTGTSVSLKQMVWRYLPEYGGYEAGIDYENMLSVPLNKLYEYNAYDAFLTKKLTDILYPKLKKEGLDFVFEEVLIPAVYAISEMEAVGLKLDTEKIARRINELQGTVEKIETTILKRKSVQKVKDFSITSTHKLRDLFFGVLSKRVKYRTATGQESLTQLELNEWAEKGNKEAQLILEYRKAYKLLRTYFMNYLEMSTGEGVLHPSYNMVVAKGGRLTSSSPNIQNVPPEVREVFISRFGGGVVLQVDFKQIEMRVMAIEAGDENLIKIFKRGGDPHRMIAAEILGVPPDQVSEEDRKHAKAVNFGLLYGMLPSTLADREKMLPAQAERFYRGFFRKYSGVQRWQAAQKQKVLQGEPIKSLFGRVRDLSIYTPEDQVNRSYNFPIQSCASDINLYFVSLVWSLMREAEMKSMLVATVHDSLVIDCHPDEVEAVKDILRTVVVALPEHFDWMVIPMAVDITTGRNWGEVK